jgi:Flp pilus assembly protein TadG
MRYAGYCSGSSAELSAPGDPVLRINSAGTSSRRGRNRRGEPERGSVTAEFAVLMPGFVLLLGALMAAGAAADAQLRCIDSARSAARLAARHEPIGAVLAAARSAAPSGASVDVQPAGALVRVQVDAVIALPLPGHPSLPISASSVALVEPDGAEP